LIGLKENEEKTFDIIFPKDYFKKELQNKKVTFNVKMKRVEEPIEIKINDEFAQKITNNESKNVKELNELIKKTLLEEKNKEIENIFKEKVLENFYNLIDTEIPDSMIQNESQYMYEDFLKKIK
jgi:trigger factor